MRTCPESINIIKKYEGLRLKPYLCPAGLKTIGYGHVILPGENFGDSISEQVAQGLLEADLKRFERGVSNLCRGVAHPMKFGALVSFAFNLGLGALQRSTLRQKVLRGEDDEVPAEFLKWVRGGGRILPGLVKRRVAEAALWQKGGRHG